MRGERHARQPLGITALLLKAWKPRRTLSVVLVAACSYIGFWIEGRLSTITGLLFQQSRAIIFHSFGS